MNDLSHKANALLELGRTGDDPTDAEISNNRAALSKQLGIAALGTGVALSATKQAAAASSAGFWTTTKIALVCSAVVAGSAVTWGIARQESDTPRSETRQVAAPATTAEPSPIVAEQPATPASAEPEPAPPARPTADPSAAMSPAKNAGATGLPSISDELTLVRGAQQHLNRGEPAAALSLLSEHARRFPSGVLSEEREASRVLALCSLGKGAAARALANDFVRRAPRSPFVDRVRAACPEPSTPTSR
ncbi:MAG TPA: hypothetical protein VHO25_10775 [Polyangiaceae bacterium]|nr:hypothetical protein [Polyangiaceae bacterium]